MNHKKFCQIFKNNLQKMFSGRMPGKAGMNVFSAAGLDSNKIFPALIAVFSLCFAASCGGLFTRNIASTDYNTNIAVTNTSNATTTTSPSFDEEKFQKLLDAGKEIETMSLPVKLDSQAALKGKVFLFRNVQAGGHKYDEGISDYRKARNLEEFKTAIRVICSKGNLLGNFREVSYDAFRTARAYGISCQVSLIDYPQGVIVAQKNFSNNERRETLSGKEAGTGEFINPPPVNEIVSYINNFQVDKPAPEMARPDEKELVRLPVTVKLKPDAPIKGKIKIAQKVQEGFLTAGTATTINSFDDYGFPFEKHANTTDELETYVRIVCVKGSPIGKVEKVMQYSSKCEVSVIDYKTLTVFAQKLFENKTLDESGAAKSTVFDGWIVRPPKQEIESYLKSFPAA